MYGVSKEAVFRWLKEYRIPTRTSVRFALVKFPECSRGQADFTNTGLYDGDGSKGTPGRVSFTNANLDLVEDQIKWLESLGVERAALKFQIGIADKKTHDAFKQKICRRFGIAPEQFWKPNTLRGVLNTVAVSYVNSEFARQFHRFRERVRDGVTNPSEAADYLKGVFAADGGAHAGKRHGCFVAFSFNARLERYLEREYRRCLGLLAVTPTADIHGSDGRLRVFLHESVVRLYRAGIFDLHISAKEAVERYLQNFKGPGARRNATLQAVFNACQELTSSGEIINAKSVGRRMGLRPGTTAYHLAELVSRGRVVRTKRTKTGGYVYNLPK